MKSIAIYFTYHYLFVQEGKLYFLQLVAKYKLQLLNTINY